MLRLTGCAVLLYSFLIIGLSTQIIFNNNCVGIQQAKFIRAQKANFIVENTNYIAVIKSLLAMYHNLQRFEKYDPDDIYDLTCHKRFRELQNFGRFLEPDSDEGKLTRTDVAYIFNTFLVKQGDQILCQTINALVPPTTCFQYLKSLEESNNWVVNTTMPTDFTTLQDVEVSIAPLVYKDKKLFWHTDLSPQKLTYCVANVGFNQLLVQQKQNLDFIRALMTKIVDFISELAPPTITGEKVIKTNDQTLVQRWQDISHHPAILQAMVPEFVQSYNVIVTYDSQANFQPSSGFMNYLDIMNLVQQTKLTNIRLKRSDFLNYLLRGSDIDKIIEVETAFSKNFESIHHTQVEITDHFNKLNTFSNYLSNSSYRNVQAIQHAGFILSNLISDQLLSRIHKETELQFLSLEKSTKIEYLALRQTLDHVTNMMNRILSIRNNFCSIGTHPVCYKSKPNFYINHDLTFTARGYMLETATRTLFQCLPIFKNDSALVFKAHEHNFIYNQGIYKDDLDDSIFLESCLKHTSLCSNLYVETQPTLFDNCYIISVFGNFYVNCRVPTEIMLSDGSLLEVSQKLVTITVTQMPIKSGNISYSVLDNSLIHDDGQTSHFDEHLRTDYRDKQSFVNDLPDTLIDFDQDDFNFDSQETPADILFPTVPSLTHYTFYTSLAAIFILTLCICCYCCVPSFRSNINNICSLLCKCLPKTCNKCNIGQINPNGTQSDQNTRDTTDTQINDHPNNEERDSAYFERLGRKAYKRIMKASSVQNYQSNVSRDLGIEMTPLQSSSVS